MRVLSGIQASGRLHLGNYFGAMKQHIELQHEHECFFFIANYHALTTIQDADLLGSLTRDVALDYLALGLDPEKVHLFRQTDVPEVTELAWILATVTGKDATYGTLYGRITTAPFTFCRTSTDDAAGVVRAYVGEGETTDDPLDTFGGYGVVKIRDLQGLMQYVCENGFEHHTAVNQSMTADALYEAMDKYLGWDVYHHGEED